MIKKSDKDWSEDNDKSYDVYKPLSTCITPEVNIEFILWHHHAELDSVAIRIQTFTINVRLHFH